MLHPHPQNGSSPAGHARPTWGASARHVRSFVDLAGWMPRLLRERRSIQAKRAIGAAEFARWLTPDLGSPFIHPVARSARARRARRADWARVRAARRRG